MLKFGIVVVLYKKHCSESVSLCSLIAALSDMRAAGFLPTIYVWNNSPDFSPAFEHSSVVWLEGKNVHLPKIYNHIARLTFESGASLLMISDDDTDYRQYDFKRNLEVVKGFLPVGGGVGCFIPQILSNERLVSPGRRLLFKGYLHKSSVIGPGLVSSKNFLAINSGTLMTKDCYERIQPLYDERLRFYGTDTDFFVRYENFYKNIYVLDSVIDHSLSEHSSESLERALFRWRDHIYATRVTFSNKSIFFRIFLAFYLFYLKTKLSCRYKTFSFFL